MKANEFVKKYGLEETKKVICLQDSPVNEVVWDIKNKKFKNDNGLATLLCETNDNFVFVPYLKCLIESHELVEKHGGLIESKIYVECCNDADLSKAILDVESCQ